MTNKPNEKIKRIVDLIGENEVHFPLRAALIKIQLIFDLIAAEGSLLESTFNPVSPEIQILRVVENYLLKYKPNNAVVDELQAILNDMTLEQIEQLKTVQLFSGNHRLAGKLTPVEQFEYDVKRINRNVNFERSADGGYKNQYLEIAWSLYRKQYFRNTGNLAARRKVHGPYYVARRDENNRLNFSEIPTPHKSYGRAEAEAKRLANKTKFNFTVLNEVGTYGPDTE